MKQADKRGGLMLKLREEAGRCLLCAEPVCTKSCKHGYDPAAMVRSVWFENKENAASHVNAVVCASCPGECEKSCIHYDRNIRIKEMIAQLPEPEEKHADLSIEFCGIKCENPFFLSSSVVASGYEMCAKALEMGWAGIVYKTVSPFMPKEASPRFACVSDGQETHFEGFRNIEQISEHTVEYDIDVLRRLKKDFPSKVIAASIMGSTDEEWANLAHLCTEAGLDFIECNFSCPHMTAKGLGADVGTNPDLVGHYTKIVKENSEIPVLAKMTPNITNMEIPAAAAVKNGADGIAAINTIKSITGIELSSMAPQPAVNGMSAVSGYSGNAVKPIALRFIHDMAVCEELKGIPISGMGGIETWKDAAEFIALGCTNVQVTTAVMQYGYRIIDDLVSGLSGFLAKMGYENLAQMAGTALSHIINADDIDRDTVSYPKFERKKCLGCGRCYISCFDGGHQAIKFGEDRQPYLVPEKCVGCHLCRLVCPAGAIKAGSRVKNTRRLS